MITHVGKYVGKSKCFFLKIDDGIEFNFIQPYFLVTTGDHPRKGAINRMDCLFGNSVWEGTQQHGWGYSWSADVFNTLIDIIHKLYDDKLSDEAKNELREINAHDNQIDLSTGLLEELQKLNIEYLGKKYRGI